MKSRYPTQILGDAVRILAINNENLRERIYSAYINELIHLDETHFQKHNKEYLKEFNIIIDSIEKYKDIIKIEDYPNGTGVPMVDLLSEEELVEVAGKIVDLDFGLALDFHKTWY